MKKKTIGDPEFEFDDLGAKVREMRIKSGMTQKEVAMNLNVTPGYISNVENNRTVPSLRLLSYFAKVTGMTFDEIVGGKKDEYIITDLDRKLQNVLSRIPDNMKDKVLRTVRMWKED
uniref:helix-turn-helix domain-containing protein n=1 Tax=Eubacterium cellulosolvens TaxID=29322 RepID=UPI0009DD3E1A|nr:helix-turn-helix transcriptional regulator [[Eubacterium] cellulosolvens]